VELNLLCRASPCSWTAASSRKGVDLRIGLDIASLASKRIVDAIVLVAGGSDLVPPMKLVRKEGLKVLLVPLGFGVRRSLKVHADRVIDVELPVG
jgi:uncharacterized LabA/DUF88 family protein